MLGILEKHRCVSHSIYKGLWQYGARHSRKSAVLPNQLCQHSSSLQHKTKLTVTDKYNKTTELFNSKWIHVSAKTSSESESKEISCVESSTVESNRLNCVDNSVTSLLNSEGKIKEHKKRKSLKKQSQVDAFVKKRFYNIEKTAKVAEISQLKLSREKGEITDSEYEKELQNLEENSLIDSGNSCSYSTLVKRDNKLGAVNTPIVNTEQVESESIIRSLIKEIDSDDNHEITQFVYEKLPSVQSEDQMTIPFPKLYHLAPLVNENAVLRNLVTIGVDLSKVEMQGYADSVLKLDFNKDVKPLLLYLHNIGVPGDKVGHVLTKNASLLVMDLNHLKTRITYLRSKQFKREDIAGMIVKNPNFLYFSTVKLDQTLGYLQKQFWLTAAELRQFVTRAPKVITMDPARIQNHVYLLQDEFGFTKREVKNMVLNYASVLKVDLNYLAERFYYLHEDMMIPYSSLIEWPEALRKNLNLIKNRHKFLEIQGRAQYNPELPNYVSLKRLLATDDTEFSCDIAKASLAEFNNFLRTV